MKQKLISLAQHRKKFASDKAAADDLGAEYMTYRRWVSGDFFSPEKSAWRRILEARGVDLPRRPWGCAANKSKGCGGGRFGDSEYCRVHFARWSAAISAARK